MSKPKQFGIFQGSGPSIEPKHSFRKIEATQTFSNMHSCIYASMNSEFSPPLSMVGHVAYVAMRLQGRNFHLLWPTVILYLPCKLR